jgi:serine/threonine protein phosphatase PrpC
MMRNALFEGHLSTYHGLLDTNIDSNFSGSTCVTIFMTSDKKIYCSNVGDSRAIICKNKNNNWSAVPLSRDQKPDDPQEMQRILKNGGRVEAFKGL